MDSSYFSISPIDMAARRALKNKDVIAHVKGRQIQIGHVVNWDDGLLTIVVMSIKPSLLS